MLLSELNIDGYNIYSQGLENNDGRGFLFYIASGIKVSLVEISSAFQECLFLMIRRPKSNGHSDQLLIGNVYRSPNSTQENDIELYKLLHYIQQKFTVPKLRVGDFNFCNITWYDGITWYNITWSIRHCVRMGYSSKCSKFFEATASHLGLLKRPSTRLRTFAGLDAWFRRARTFVVILTWTVYRHT